MAFFERLTAHQQRNMLAMAERLDAHFAESAFASDRPVSYGRLGTHIADPKVRREELAFHHAELVALHSAVFDLPDIAFQGDDAIIGLAKRHATELFVTPRMMIASYTFMQWLGTHVGRAFIRDLDEAIKAHQAMTDHEQRAQLDELQGMLDTYFKARSRGRQLPLNAEELGLFEGDAETRVNAAKQHRYALLALSTYLNLQRGGTRPDTRNVFDYNMDKDNSLGTSSFYAADAEQVAAMSLVTWLGTPEGAAHLRFLDAHRVDAMAA